jgi:probable HAF family extracellular repeat protein
MKVPFAITASCLLLCCVAAAQASYDFKSFGNPGATVTRVFGLNGHGELVGADDSLPGRHAFLLNHDSHVVLDSSGVLGTHTSFARGINNRGDIVGGYFDDDGTERGFLFRHGTLTTIDVPFAGSLGTQLDGLNDSGIIVGVWVDGAFTVHGFIYQNGSFVHLDYPGALGYIPLWNQFPGGYCRQLGYGPIDGWTRLRLFKRPDLLPRRSGCSPRRNGGGWHQ